MKVIRKQTNSKDCIVCGVNNKAGINASFYEMEDGTINALFSFGFIHQSYPERTHGGLISAVLDELIGRAIWINEPDQWGVTMKLTVEYHKPVPYGVPLKGMGKITKSTKLTFEGMGEIYDEEGHMLARGYATYFKLPLEKIATSAHAEEVNVMIPDDVKEIA
ncbi:MAG: PaaI family thioesterase [Bacilli bacterium]|nr:PaaI family thioesterase [Bacilli bacterium]